MPDPGGERPRRALPRQPRLHVARPIPGRVPPDDCVEDEAFILQDSERVIKTYHNDSPGSMTQIVLAPCSPFSVTISLLRDSAALARQYKVKLHTHLCETLTRNGTRSSVSSCDPSTGWRRTAGWVTTSGAPTRSMWTTKKSKSSPRPGCGVAHCPCSNMRLGSGIAPIKKYLAAGVKVGLGVDGSASNDASNILLETRQAMLLARLQMAFSRPKVRANIPSFHNRIQSARARMDDGARGAGARDPGRRTRAWTFRHRLARAWQMRRLLLPRPPHHRLRRRPPRPRGGHPLLRPTSPNTVIHGKIVVRDGEIVTVDMKPVIETHNRCAARLANES